jgi:hypothetical protein
VGNTLPTLQHCSFCEALSSVLVRAPKNVFEAIFRITTGLRIARNLAQPLKARFLKKAQRRRVALQHLCVNFCQPKRVEAVARNQLRSSGTKPLAPVSTSDHDCKRCGAMRFRIDDQSNGSGALRCALRYDRPPNSSLLLEEIAMPF